MAEQIAVELTAIDNATAVFTKVQGGMEMLAKAGTVLTDVLGALGIGFGLEQMASFAERAIKLGEDLYKLHERTGFTVEGLSELRIASDLAGVGFDAVGSAVAKFEKNMVEASDGSSKMGRMINELGVDITQGPQKAFEQFLKTANQIEDPALKVAAFKEAFGKTGDQMILVAGDMERAEQMAKALGLTMSESTAKAAKELADNFKLLKSGGEALEVLFLGGVAEGLTTLTGNMVRAAEQGHKVWGIFNEIAKVAYALIGTIPGLDKFAFAGFQALDQLGGDHSVSGKIRGPDGKPLVPDNHKPINEDKLRKIMSGADKGDRAAAGGKSEMSFDELMAKGEMARLKQQDEIENQANEAAKKQEAHLDQLEKKYQDLQDPLRKYHEELLEIGELYAAGRIGEQEMADRSKKIYEQMDLDAAKLAASHETWNGKIKDSTNYMKDLGFVMVSSFENAVTSGKKLSDVLSSLLSDLAKVALRKGVLDPLGKAFDVWMGGGSQSPAPIESRDIGSAMGVPSYDVGTDYVPQTGLALIHQGEKITPAGQNSGGGNVTINFTGGPPVDPQAFLAQVVPVMRSIAMGEIGKQLRPGGVLS